MIILAPIVTDWIYMGKSLSCHAIGISKPCVDGFVLEEVVYCFRRESLGSLSFWARRLVVIYIFGGKISTP